MKFVMVGVVNTIVGTSIMFVFYNVFHLSYWVSSASNYFFGSICSYFLNKRYTFHYHEKGFRSLVRFTVNILACYLLAYGFAKPLIQWILDGFSQSVQENISMLLGMCLFIVFNYIGQRFFAFKLLIIPLILTSNQLPIYSSPISHLPSPLLEEVMQTGLYTVSITTINGEEPQATTIESPWQPGSFNITYTNKVACRIQISQAGNLLYDSGEYQAEKSGATIRINGNTTALYSNPLNMPYKLKLEQAADLLHRGNDDTFADKHWRLLKDGVSLNTVIGLKVSQIVGMEWTSAYVPCNVIINGDYRGLYLLMETVKRNNSCRISCDKLTGSIIERDPYWWKETTYFTSAWYTGDSMYRWTWKYPSSNSVDGSSRPTQEEYMQHYVNSMEQSLEDDTYHQYIDITSWVRWLLIHDILGTRDSGGANMYFKKNNNTAASLLEMPCVWDFDSNYEVTPGTFSRLHTSEHAYFSTLLNSSNNLFAKKYVEQWNAIKPHLKSQLTNFINTYATTAEAHAIDASRQLHNRRWNTTYGSVIDDINTALQWFDSHIETLDRNIQLLTPPISSSHSTLHSPLYINGHIAPYDSISATWTATIPESLFQKQQTTLTVSSSSPIYINGNLVNGNYNFGHITNTSTYPCTISSDTGNIRFTFLPIIKLTGDFGYDYVQGTITIANPDEPSDTTYSARLKWRGGSTNAANKHKRNYSIKFPEDIKLFDMRKDNNWVLDAGQSDVFRLRNKIAMDLWNDMAHQPYYADLEPKARNAVSGRVVELFLNNEYRGIYNLCEKMDRKQLKLKKVDESGAVHGVLYKGVSWYNTMMFDSISEYNNYSNTLFGYEMKYPEAGEDCDTTDWKPLIDAVNKNQFLSHDDESFKKQVDEWFDIPVMIDYSIFITSVNALDNRGKNMLWAIYDKASTNRLTIATWDLDLTFGQRWGGILNTPEYDNTSPDSLTDVVNGVYVNLYRTNALQFNDRLNQRYQNLRQTGGILSTDSLIRRINNYYQTLKNSGAAKREESKWSGDSDVWGDEINFDKEYDYICNWITQHMETIDKKKFPVYYNKEYFDVSSVPMITSSTKQNRSAVYTLSGQRIEDARHLQPGIYIVNNRKVAIYR